MEQGLLKIAVHALPQHGRVEVVRNRHLGTGVEEEQRVQHDVEAVHGELVLSFHSVHELELDGLGPVVAEGDERPPGGSAVGWGQKNLIFFNFEELSRIKSSPLPRQPGRVGVNSTQLLGPMNSAKISPQLFEMSR